MRRRLALVVVLVLVAGCGGGEDAPSAEGTRAEPATESAPDTAQDTGRDEDPSGLETHEFPQHGFSIGVPGDWHAVDAQAVVESGGFEDFARANPELAPFAEALRRPNSPLKLLAVDPNARGSFATNVNVLVEDLPAEVTLEAYAEANLRQLPAATGVRAEDIDRRDVRLPAGNAVRVSYEPDFAGGSAEAIRSLQYYLVSGGRAFVVTFTTVPNQAEGYADEFDASIRSFRLL